MYGFVIKKNKKYSSFSNQRKIYWKKIYNRLYEMSQKIEMAYLQRFATD